MSYRVTIPTYGLTEANVTVETVDANGGFEVSDRGDLALFNGGGYRGDRVLHSLYANGCWNKVEYVEDEAEASPVQRDQE